MPPHELGLLESRILIGPHLLNETGQKIRNVVDTASRAAVLFDEKVRGVADTASESLRAEGFDVASIPLSASAGIKTLETARTLYSRLLTHRMDRNSPVIAVGGGEVCDLAGFVASTYHRGLPSFLIPTTLLAQVDAAIGGKTALDHDGVKNLVGTFHLPRIVFIDPKPLGTLPPREFQTGLAEIIKCGMILDRELFETLEHQGETLRADQDLLVSVIVRAVTIKARLVEEDLRESGPRELLNFGHTIGHVLESLTGMSHGEAVAVGMRVETAAAVAIDLAPESLASRLDALLQHCGLPLRSPAPFEIDRVVERLVTDKKARNGRLRFSLPESLGRGRRGVEISENQLRPCLKIALP